MDKLLKKLSDINAVSGNETAMIRYVVGVAKTVTDDIKTDSMNNIYVFRKGYGTNRKKVMLCAHMDEVGMIVSSFTKDGYIKFRVVGGIDSSVLIARTVIIGDNAVKGVTGIKAVHLTNKEERKKKPSVNDMYIDIGAESEEEAMSLVKIGDYISFDTNADDFGTLVKGKAFDDRVGCYILCSLMQKEFYDDVVYCFTVQEETGLRGATVAAHNINSDCCFVLESTTCFDLPGVSEDKRVTHIGDGPVLSIADRVTYADKELNMKFASCCDKFQYKRSGSGGNDAGAIHLKGIRTSSVSIPARYIHSPVSVVSYDDVKACINAFDKMLSKGVFDFD